MTSQEVLKSIAASLQSIAVSLQVIAMNNPSSITSTAPPIPKQHEGLQPILFRDCIPTAGDETRICGIIRRWLDANNHRDVPTPSADSASLQEVYDYQRYWLRKPGIGPHLTMVAQRMMARWMGSALHPLQQLEKALLFINCMPLLDKSTRHETQAYYLIRRWIAHSCHGLPITLDSITVQEVFTLRDHWLQFMGFGPVLRATALAMIDRWLSLGVVGNV